MTATDEAITGGCLCGAVRYRVAGAPLWVAHCHCQSCRRQTGAPFTSFVGVKRDDVTFEDEAPRRHQSSPGVWRSFCPHCGSPIAYEGERWPEEIHFHLGTLDRPEDFPPSGHVYTAEQMPWLHFADGLPRHAATGG